MNTIEILNDLVNVRGALLELYPDGPGQRDQRHAPLLKQIVAAELTPTTLNYVALDAALSPQPSALNFASCKRLSALAVGFYDQEGELIGRLAQIRECELEPACVEKFTRDFVAYEKDQGREIARPK